MPLLGTTNALDDLVRASQYMFIDSAGNAINGASNLADMKGGNTSSASMWPSVDSTNDSLDNSIYGNTGSEADKLANMSPREQLLYLINNDSENSTAWKQALLNFDQNNYYRDTEVSNMVKQLKENGINPILAYNMISGYNPTVNTGTAANNETSKKVAETQTSSNTTNTVIGGIFNLIGSIFKAVASYKIGKALKITKFF